MFIGNKLIYIELEKTGSTHILKLLNEYAEGVVLSKHNRLLHHDGSRIIVGSVRNPWNWYLSLWSFGCGQIGREFDILCTWQWRKIFNGRQPVILPRKKWRSLYSDVTNPIAFREWLHLLLDSTHKNDIQEGYGKHTISNFAGLYTYRYMKMYSGIDITGLDFSSIPDIKEFDSANNLLGFVIQVESLESDFIKLLKAIGQSVNVALSEQLNVNSASPENFSFRPESIQYYDTDSKELVNEKESFLIDKYGYTYLQ